MAVSYASGSQAISTNDTYNFKEMIKKLREIEEIPARKLLKWKADWELRVDGFNQIKTSLTTLRDSLSKINSVDKFLVKSATSSDETKVKATATAGAQAGDYKVEVKQLARNAISAFSSAGITSKDTVLNNTDANQTFEYNYAGSVRSIDVAPGTTLTGLVNLINNSPTNPGVRAMIIQDGNQFSFQLRGMDLGADKTLSITSNTDVNSKGCITLGDGTKSVTAPTVSTASFNFGTGVNGATVLNTSGGSQTFTINYNTPTASPATITLLDGETLDKLVSEINSKTSTTGVTASLVTTGGNTTLKLTGNIAGAAAGTIGITSDITDGTIDLSTGWNNVDGVDSKITYGSGTFTSGTDVINSTGSAQNFQFFVKGEILDFTVAGGADLDSLIAQINAVTTTPNGVAVTLNASLSGGNLVITAVGTSPDGSPPLADSKASGAVDFNSGVWTNQAPQNAQYKVNGWPAGTDYLESATNNVDDVIEGVTLHFRSEGTSEVVVGVDNNAIKENVDAFIKAYNTFKTTYATLTDVDATKKTYDPEYTDSLFDMQKGGVLTGNYVVQMIGSQLSQILGGAAKGFINAVNTPSSSTNPKENFWDPFSTLSAIGIVTDSDKNSSTFGLLIYDQDTKLHNGKTAFEAALAKDPAAVSELFSANNLGQTNSNNFSFLNSLSGITQAGAYDVRYEVDGSGNIINAFIDGKAAGVDGNQITAMDSSSGSQGLVITVNNMVPGTYSGDKVFIKQGVANELYSAISMNDTKEDPVTHEMVNYKGAIARMTDLIAQYMGDSSGNAATQGIIRNIEKKIDQENQRLAVWERFMTNKFARLETVLGKYEKLQKSMESQIKQLSSGSSS